MIGPTSILSHRYQTFEALCSWRQEQRLGEGDVYVLVDMAGIGDDRIAAKVLRTLKDRGAVSMLGPRAPDAARAIPWLVPADHHQGDEWLRETALWATRDPCLTWLASPLQINELAARLQVRADAMLPESYAVLLRFFDPRVLPVLGHVLTKEQAEPWWALGHSWAYLDRSLNLQNIELTSPPSRDTFVTPLQLEQVQVDALLAEAEIDRVMPELVREVPAVFLAKPPAERLAFTRRWLTLADQWHIDQFSHRVMLGVLALKLGENFHQEKQWRPWIERLKQGGMSLLDVIKHASAQSQ